MNASYMEFDIELNGVSTKFYLYENDNHIFVYVGQNGPKQTLFNGILEDKLKKIEPYKSKKRVIFCKINSEKDVEIVKSVLMDISLGQSIDNIRERFRNHVDLKNE